MSRPRLEARFASSRALSRQELAGIAGATKDEIAALADGNREYELKFGFVFLVCATGKSAADILARLPDRLTHDPAEEIRIAAEEQSEITAIRLEGLRREGLD
jgi:2-oxo-4-hydroxy-4-carboxy-5-ureidoimidazoline decarboxylase